MPGIQLQGSGSQLDASVNTIISSFKELTDAKGVVKRLATPYTLKPHEGTTKVILNYGRLTASRITNGVDLTQAQDLADTQTVYTPTELAIKMILAQTTLDRVADPQLMGRVGRMMGNAYDLLEDTEGCDQMANWSGTDIGAAAAILQPGHLLAAAVRLDLGQSVANPEPPPTPHYFLLHPAAVSAIVGRLMPLSDVPTGTNAYTGLTADRGVTLAGGTNSMTEKLWTQGIIAIGHVMGKPVFLDPNIGVDASDDADQGCFAKDGLVFVNEKSPSMEKEKDISWRAWELVMVGRNIWGTFRPANYGVQIITDAQLPSS